MKRLFAFVALLLAAVPAIAADTTTTNYGLVKPEIGASNDSWGTKTNSNWDIVDAQLKAALDAANAAAATAAAAMPKTGGTFTDAIFVTTSGRTASISATDTGAAGAGIGLYGNGTTTPNKFIRANAGNLEFINSAYSSIIATLSDGGKLSVNDFRSNSASFGTAGVDGNLNVNGSTGIAGSLNVNGTAALAAITTPGSIAANGAISTASTIAAGGAIKRDSGLYLDISGNAAQVVFSTNNSQIYFDRAANKFVFVINSVAVASMDGGGTIRTIGNVIANTAP